MRIRFGTTLLIAIFGLTALLLPLQAKPGGRNAVYYKDQVAVLMYHHIHDKDTSSGTITSALFREQLEGLRANGYQFITLSAFKRYMEGASVPANAVLVTFDDGYQSFYTHAYPILTSMDIPAVNFVITGTLADPLASYIPSLSAAQIAEMTSGADPIDVQCHTDSLHLKLPNGQAALVGRLEQNGSMETEDAYKQRILQDSAACRQKLAALYPQPIDTYAYPFGIQSQQAAQLVADAGFRYAFTISPAMATRHADRMRIPRINAGSPGITADVLHRTIQRRVVGLSGLLPGLTGLTNR